MVDNGQGAVREEKFRLLWLHYIKPYYPNEIISFLESQGAAIVFGEANHVYWGPLDPARPFESLAAKMLANPSGGPLERRASLALEFVDRYNIDGVIHFSHWGCRQSCGGEYVIRDMMRKKGVPMLVLDGDGADSRNYSKEQTRLEAGGLPGDAGGKAMITAGVDIGSLTAKAVVLGDDGIAGYCVMPGGSDVTAAAGRVLAPPWKTPKSSRQTWRRSSPPATAGPRCPWPGSPSPRLPATPSGRTTWCRRRGWSSMSGGRTARSSAWTMAAGWWTSP